MASQGPESGIPLALDTQGGIITPRLVRKFWGCVDETKKKKCWEWQGGRYPAPKNYGYMVISSGVCRMAHRLSYAINVGPVEPGIVVRHTCDNPPCVNPNHLIAGTQQQNVADISERLVSEKTARQIRQERLSGTVAVRVLAETHGVTPARVQGVLDNKIRPDSNWDPQLVEGLHAPRPDRTLSDDEVNEVRELWSKGELRIVDVARRFGLSHSNSAELLYGRMYRHLPLVRHPKTGKVCEYDKGRRVMAEAA